MINCLELITSLNMGGTEKYLLDLASFLKNKYCISVGYLKDRGQIADKMEQAGIEVVHMRSPLAVYSYLKKKRIDILHTHLYRANIIGRTMGHLAKTPVIISTQQSIDAWKKSYHILIDSLTSRWADLVIANSNTTKNVIEKREKIPPDKIKTVYNGLDLASYNIRFNKEYLCRKYKLDKMSIIIGSVTRLHPEKGAHYIPYIALEIIKEFPEARILIAGDGFLRKDLHKVCARLGLEGRLIFSGWIEDIPEFVNLIDIFFLPSEEESFPQAILEAMAAGKPVIASDVGGVHELVDDRETGFLVRKGDINGFARRISELIKDPRKGREMGRRGMDRVRKFGIERMLSETSSLYEQLIRRKLPGRVPTEEAGAR